MRRNMKNTEVCNECGRIVNLGSGLFVNRVLDMDDRKTRKENKKTLHSSLKS